MVGEDRPKTFVFRSFVNSFRYLYQDAEYLHQIAQRKELEGRFEPTQLCRTAVLLYILSLEGLINRALDHFLREDMREFFLEREARFSLQDKWLLLPMLPAGQEPAQFDKSRYPWSHFSELVRLRNDFVHPKHDRPAYYRAISSHRWEPLPWNEIPADLRVREKDVVYPQTQIPKDPYAIRLEHVGTTKKVVDDIVSELDRLLSGRILRDDWCRTDQMKLIYPPNATLDDLARELPKTPTEQ